ncbi:MAG: RCC1 domain-containing protein [Ferruginibacter sp.]
MAISTNGTIGDSSHQIDKLRPVAIATDKTWRSIATGDFSSAAVNSDGTIWSWDENTFCRLENGTNQFHYYPQQIGAGQAR